MFIIYSDEVGEVIVCTPETEPETLKIWFEEGGRSLEDWERKVHSSECVCISNHFCIEW